ncbi:MAG: carboxypeptidase regulatory-like domain-containing protein [Candidatus Riflebacteria bacterium]|nr:carboxypeptidase regulatory-like domain-containing protein [Candidatus Riflebacteria bacterium]
MPFMRKKIFFFLVILAISFGVFTATGCREDDDTLTIKDIAFEDRLKTINEGAEGTKDVTGVVLKDSKPVANAEVYLNYSGRLVSKTQTTADGVFFFRGLAEGAQYELIAVKGTWASDSYLLHIVPGGSTIPSDIKIEFVESAAVELSPGKCLIYGQVMDPQYYLEPQTSLYIMLFKAIEAKQSVMVGNDKVEESYYNIAKIPEAVRKTFTKDIPAPDGSYSSKGHYIFENLEPGTYMLLISKTDELPEFESISYSNSMITWQTVKSRYPETNRDLSPVLKVLEGEKREWTNRP